RGVWHQWGFYVSLVAGAALVLSAVPHGSEAVIACVVYVLSIAGLLGTSATYHRVAWRTAAARAWMRRLDHAMIFVLIGGTYTPVALLALEPPLGTIVLLTVWIGGAVGIAINLVWITAPRWLIAAIYVALGWVAVLATNQLAQRTGPGTLALFALGGVLYTGGAVVYARRRPDPRPGIFGYHEVFHACVVLALATHFAAIAFVIVPQA
nr:hemolysin III family protein [Solirubrobacterales bacterium]